VETNPLIMGWIIQGKTTKYILPTCWQSGPHIIHAGLTGWYDRLMKRKLESKAREDKAEREWWHGSLDVGRCICLLGIRERKADEVARDAGWKVERASRLLERLVKSGLVERKGVRFALRWEVFTRRFLELAMGSDTRDSAQIDGDWESKSEETGKYAGLKVGKLLKAISCNQVFRVLLRDYFILVEYDFNVKPLWIHTPADLAGVFEWVLVSRGERLAGSRAPEVRRLVTLLRKWRAWRLSIRTLHEDALEMAMVENGLLQNIGSKSGLIPANAA